MRAVEMRSLNLLEGGLGASKLTRGVPMAAGKPMGPAGAKGGMAGGGAGGGGMAMSNGIPAIGAQQAGPPTQQQQQQAQRQANGVHGHPAPAVPPPPQPAATAAERQAPAGGTAPAAKQPAATAT